MPAHEKHQGASARADLVASQSSRSVSTGGFDPSRKPYLIEGPALISFSGGRTSGYMLWHILDAYGGELPGDVYVAFANTGKEREETLRFVHDCETHWGVRVHWLEWRNAKPCFEEVGYNSAARNGEPFAALIGKKGYLPNAVTRFCTMELKVRVMRDFAQSQGWKHWNNIVGLRADEMLRVFKAYDRNASGKEPWKSLMPLADAKVRNCDVRAWWAAQPFDLQLQPYEGNCDLCFLKARAKLKTIIRDDPSKARWWNEQEVAVTGKRATKAGARFVTEYSYADLVREVAASPLLPLEEGDDDEFDAECGLWCAGEAA
jgi:3'-phosphoadenosine 5'-phosphosulfate sulfotransferase (PAPS reductase)/FAD synthetase